MSNYIIFVNPLLAQSPAQNKAAAKKVLSSQAPATSPASNYQVGQVWMFTSGAMFLIALGLAVYGKRQVNKLTKKVKIEEYKNGEIQKKLKLALQTIRKMETNPDLIHSREFNLDYLRLRMEEETFNLAILNQVKNKVKQIISVALRPNEQATIGIANQSGRQIDETFDVMYEMEHGEKRTKRVLFRVQIKLMKLPSQSSSTTVSQVVDCVEKFLSLSEDHNNWQPTIQGRLALMDWDQKAKPTPLLVVSQSTDGVNVSFRIKPHKAASVHQ
jgi:hypothetical protein